MSISENRLKHIIGVARKCYSLALERGHNEEYAKKMFMLGYLHDVGYEFSKDSIEHPEVGSELCRTIGCDDSIIETIKGHGLYGNTENEEYIILNTADMLIDAEGNEVTVYARLDDIKDRYGEHSNQYLTACDVCYLLKLTGINLAGHLT